jgi:hypothetical protein
MKLELFFFIMSAFVAITPANAYAQKNKPVSLSYEQVVQCFPELHNDKLAAKMDLNLLKEVIDEKFITSQSQLRQRKVRYLDADDHLNNLILRSKFAAGKKQSTTLTLQRVDDKGVVTDVKLPDNQRINPKQETVNGFLEGAQIQRDDWSYIDTKLNRVVSTYRRNFKSIEELELSAPSKKRSVSCYIEQDLVICTCSKK